MGFIAWCLTSQRRPPPPTTEKWMRMGIDHRVRDSRGRPYTELLLNLTCLFTAVLVYALNTWIIKPHTSIHFVHAYLNDVFAMPFMLAYSNLLIHFAKKPSYAFTTVFRVSLLTVFCIFCWEYLAPVVNASSTGDPLDALAYSLGSVVYLFAASKCGNVAGSIHT